MAEVSSLAQSNSSSIPLPFGQLSLLLLLRFCESASTVVIYPFLKELLASVTGDEERVGYYAGVMESTRQFVSLLTVMYWSRLSDHIGRKPVLLIGTLALSISTFSFGLSKTFVALVISRCIFTAFNSNAGVIKGTIGEITDNSNSADAFALLHAPWGLGSSFGAMVGGSLARPHDYFPKRFASEFWKKYPYFLPCSVMCCVSLTIVVLVLVFLRETVPGGYFYPSRKDRVDDEVDESQPLLVFDDTSPPVADQSLACTSSASAVDDASIPVTQLLTTRVLIPIINYVSIASLYATFNTILPLFFSMPVSMGGLALLPRKVGYILGVYGLVNSCFQTVMLGRFVKWFGVKKVFLCATIALMPMFILAPCMNLVLKWRMADGRSSDSGMGILVWTMLVLQMGCACVMELGFGCIYMYITSSSPSKRSLGAVNGLAQMWASVGRIAMPASASALLSYSIEHHILGGFTPYVVMALLACVGVGLGIGLPSRLEDYKMND